jgi:hypothetical protein
VIRHQSPYERKHRIRAMRGAKENLIARVVQIECGRKRRLREIFDPAQRPHDAHAFRSLARAGRTLKPSMPRHDHTNACEMQEGSDCAKTARQYGRHCHRICDYADRMTTE